MVEELSEEDVKELTKMVLKYNVENAMPDDYTEVLSVIKGKCADGKKHRYVYHEDFDKQVDEFLSSKAKIDTGKMELDKRNEEANNRRIELDKRKAEIEKELKGFAKKDTRLKGDYDTKFPNFGSHQSSDEAAQELASYENALPMEYALELKLKDIEIALEKIKNGEYGICANCKKEINPERLKAKPESKFCLDCKTKIK